MSEESEVRREKTREEYSRNVKKLKIKLAAVQSEIVSLERRVDSLANTSNDKLIAMKIAKFCKERRFTPEMLFRFADRTGKQSITKLQFQETLAQLGLKLSKDEFLRLEYLIDEDLSGEISYSEYRGYLEAFGVRKEFSAQDQLAKDALQKLDIGKILQITEQNGQDNDRKRTKHPNLLNYEQFIKYCHKHFPGLKNKELASIFTRLEKNQLINLQDLIDYLEGQEAEKKRLEEKNKKKKLKREDSKIQPLPASGERTLRYIIQALLRSRGKESTIVFHSLEFLRLERVLGTRRGQLLQLFQEIDHKRKGTFRGSFTHNELINYFIEKSANNEDLPFAFTLMGHKLTILKQNPQAVVAQYAANSDFLTEDELRKFFEGEFEVIFQEYNAIARHIPREQDGRYSVEKIVDLLRHRDGKRTVIVKPNNCPPRLIFRTGHQALRCCLQLEQRLAQLKQTRWHDYEFGPTEADEFGGESINLPMPSEQIEWDNCEELGMTEFFREDLNTTYTCSSICPNQNFGKTLLSLAITCPGFLWSSEKVDSTIRDISEEHLGQIFSGVYPLAFHYFAKYGIYVLRLFLKEKWRYVIVDSKVPCAADKTPFFISTANRRFSFLSIIEKGYAKALGSYAAIYAVTNPHQYIIQLGNLLPFEYSLQKTMPESSKNFIWQGLVKFQKDEAKALKEGKRKPKAIFGVIRGRSEEAGKELALHVPLKIQEVVELPDNKCKNSHKSHRLLLVRAPAPLRQEAVWNRSWNRQQAGNKYSQMTLQLGEKVVDASLLKSKDVMLLNFKLFREIFSLYHIEPLNFADMIILRKELQFEEKFKCRYEVTAISELEFLLVLAQRSLAPDARILIEAKNNKEEVLWKQSRREELAVRAVKVERGQSITLELSVENWKLDIDYRYSLTLYMRHPRYELKQRDRHMLFRYVSPYEEQPKFDFSEFEGEEKQFIFRNFYKAAERRGCC